MRVKGEWPWILFDSQIGLLLGREVIQVVAGGVSVFAEVTEEIDNEVQQGWDALKSGTDVATEGLVVAEGFLEKGKIHEKSP